MGSCGSGFPWQTMQANAASHLISRQSGDLVRSRDAVDCHSCSVGVETLVHIIVWGQV